MANIETLLADTRYFAEVAAPSTPASGGYVIYAKTDGKLYGKNDAGTEVEFGAAGAGIAATIFDAKGDIIAATAADTAARVAAGANGTILTADTASTPGLKWHVAGFARYRRTGGNYTVNTTSFADIDATNLNFTITTLARRVKAILDFNAVPTASGLTIDLLVDGVLVGGGDGGVFYSTVTVPTHFHLEILTDVLTAGSHTFKWQARMNVAGSGTIHGGTAAPATPLLAWVEETLFTA